MMTKYDSFANAKKFKVIKTNNGKKGNIDSIKIKRHANIGPYTPKASTTFTITLFIQSNIY